MAYEVSYDSDTEDEQFTQRHPNRAPRGVRMAGDGRYVAPYLQSRSEMEAQIHKLEQEAYSAVLRAFKAQSDYLTWDQEGLMTELRKELRVSDDENRKLLARVNADATIRSIREWRQAGGQQAVDPIITPTVSGSRKKQKTSHSVPFQSMQPSSSAGKRGSASGGRGRMRRLGQQLPGLSSVNSMQYRSGPPGRGQFISHGSSTFGASDHTEDSLIGRKVRIRWPEDNTFYEAVITQYDSLQGRHALVYYKDTPKETWEWVDLKEISPEDIRFDGEDPGIFHRAGVGSAQGRGLFPCSGRGRESLNNEPIRELPPSQNGTVKNDSDDIELRDTQSLITEVEKVLDANQPDRAEIEKAKLMLKEHEQALVNAIAKLRDASDGESDGEQQFAQRQSMERNRQGGDMGEMRRGRADDPPAEGGGRMALDNQQDDEYIDDI